MAKVSYERVDGHIALVTINSPNTLNALSPEVAVQLAKYFKEIAEDETVRVVVVTGAGRVFCSGADLGRLIPLVSGQRKPEDEWDRAYLEDPFLFEIAILRGFDIGKPVLCAANGHAIAGGLELLMGTDIRVTCSSAKFGLQEPKWGLFPLGGSTVRLPRQVPFAVAMEILLTANLISAERAERIGLVNFVVDEPSQVLPKTLQLARDIARNGPFAVKSIRQSVRKCEALPEKEALQIELEIGRKVFAHPDAREGPKAFKEKRTPVWSKSKL